MFACRLLLGFALVVSISGCRRAELPVLATEAALPEPTAAPSEPKPQPANPELASFEKPFPGGPGGIRPLATPPIEIGEVEYHPTRLEPVARDFFAKGQYKEALDAYTGWAPWHTCGNGYLTLRGERYYRMALCSAHLKDHAAAARVCLEVAGRIDWWGDADEFLVQLYREAGQLDDLGPLLDVIEKAVIDKHQKSTYLTSDEDRASLERSLHTRAARRILNEVKLGNAKPWPDDVPKPKPGSLPKALTN